MRIEAESNNGSTKAAVEIGLIRIQSKSSVYILAELNGELCFRVLMNAQEAKILYKSIQNDLELLEEEPENE